MKSHVIRAAATVLALSLSTGASAAIVEFSGLDPLAGPLDPRPSSNATAAAFDAALAPGFGVVDFEGLSLGFLAGPLLVAPGVTVTITNGSSLSCGGICDDAATPLGYNTTSGGQNYLRTVPQAGGPDVAVTFAFATPISAFGGYFTGTETAVSGFLSIRFDDGTAQELLPPEPLGTGGGVFFYGFTDAGASITSVTIHEIGPFQSSIDIWGLDDVRFGSAAAETAVPEPTTLALLGAGLAGLVRRARSRRG